MSQKHNSQNQVLNANQYLRLVFYSYQKWETLECDWSQIPKENWRIAEDPAW
jgi:hypothetical protein